MIEKKNFKTLMKQLTRMAILVYFGCHSLIGLASSVSLGLGTLEGGDDRWQVASQLAFSSSDGYRIATTYQQLDWGPLTQSVWLIHGGYEFPFIYSNLTGSAGLVYLQEATILDFDPPIDPSFDEREIQHNFGVSFGIHLHNSPSSAIMYGISWESHLFLAGLSAGLFLATGRKQSITIHGGFRL